jgi:hypothetical protein
MVAPEHRLSLEVKGDELWQDEGLKQELVELEALPYIDIMDENDVLLHHRQALCV